MPRNRILVAALAALALAAPTASADPHYLEHLRPDSAVQAETRAATEAELRARGRDGVQTGSLAGTTDATTRALEQERAYSTYGEPAPLVPAAPAAVAAGDGPPWVLIAAGLTVLLGTAALLIARLRRVRVAA